MGLFHIFSAAGRAVGHSSCRSHGHMICWTDSIILFHRGTSMMADQQIRHNTQHTATTELLEKRIRPSVLATITSHPYSTANTSTCTRGYLVSSNIRQHSLYPQTFRKD